MENEEKEAIQNPIVINHYFETVPPLDGGELDLFDSYIPSFVVRDIQQKPTSRKIDDTFHHIQRSVIPTTRELFTKEFNKKD